MCAFLFIRFFVPLNTLRLLSRAVQADAGFYALKRRCNDKRKTLYQRYLRVYCKVTVSEAFCLLTSLSESIV